MKRKKEREQKQQKKNGEKERKINKNPFFEYSLTLFLQKDVK